MTHGHSATVHVAARRVETEQLHTHHSGTHTVGQNPNNTGRRAEKERAKRWRCDSLSCWRG